MMREWDLFVFLLYLYIFWSFYVYIYIWVILWDCKRIMGMGAVGLEGYIGGFWG